jgi:ElaB/YqjD/DUF883 family membrane-anchored ribosome-binding protein
MNSRISAYLLAPRIKRLALAMSTPASRSPVHKQIAYGMQRIETYVQEHPVTAIGAAFCTGIFLGWVIKRR